MELDKKTVIGAVAAVAVGAIGAAVAYNTLGGDSEDSGAKPAAKRTKPTGTQAKATRKALAASTDMINVNKASFAELVSLKHVGKARAKRILDSRPFKSVEDLTSRGIVPEEVLSRHRDRLAV
jgi:DNA uptake protein ComE-like DNA-binding protein